MRKLKVVAIFLVLLVVSCLYILFFPSTFYPQTSVSENFTLSTKSVSNDQKDIIFEVDKRLGASELYNVEHSFRVFGDVGGLYPSLVSRMLGRGYGNGYHKNIVITAELDWTKDIASLNNQNWSLTDLISHEAVHSLQFQGLGWSGSNPIAGYPLWKWEGYAEYIGRGKQGIHHLIKNIELFQNTETSAWAAILPDATVVPRNYLESWILVHFALEVKELSYKELLKDGLTLNEMMEDLLAWYSSTKRTRMFQGAIVRGDTTKKQIALVFTGDQFAEGGDHIVETLGENQIKGSFFFTGNFYRNPDFNLLIRSLKSQGHYLGAHSDAHLLYCDWTKRDSLLVSEDEFKEDLLINYKRMEEFGVEFTEAPYFLPPYEWYNEKIADWTSELDLQLINITYGTLSHADYTTQDLDHYRSSEEIYSSIISYEETNRLNGFILLVHVGAGPERTDKFYLRLNGLINDLSSKGYSFIRIDELLNP